jgi:hypothetical protein
MYKRPSLGPFCMASSGDAYPGPLQHATNTGWTTDVIHPGISFLSTTL